MSKIVVELFVLLVVAGLPFSISAETKVPKITIMTEVYPPYNMEVGGRLRGISVDILDAMLKMLHTGQTIDDCILTNWSRAYSLAEKRNNHMVFSTTRTAKREPLFRWVGPITKTTIGIIALKSKSIVINKLSDLDHFRIGAVLKDIGEQTLVEVGVSKKQIHSIGGKNVIDLSFKKMENDRIDLFAYEVNVAMYEANLQGHNVDDFEVVYTLKEGELYYAFNRNTDDMVVIRWQDALDTIKSNGLYKKILESY